MDTTYYQERVALGKVLHKLERRDEAEIMAWNFFKQPGKENELVGPTHYEPYHVDMMLEELQTNHIDILVIHAHSDTEKLQQEMELAGTWMEEGKVKKVGLGMVQLEHLERLPADHPVTHVLAPYNAFNQAALELFVKAGERGLSTIALSPFIRGWKLDELGEDKDSAAEILLRWVASQQVINHIIVSMRMREWVSANLKAVNRGPLSRREQAKLNDWIVRSR